MFIIAVKILITNISNYRYSSYTFEYYEINYQYYRSSSINYSSINDYAIDTENKKEHC